MSPPLLKTVRTLKDSTFEACACISTHLKASASATAENTAKADRNDLKSLTIELRLLGGTLYSLESLIVELSVDNDAADSTLGITPSASGSENDPSQEWPIVDGYEILLTAIKGFHHLATSDGIKAARSSLQDIRSKLAFVLGVSDTLEDISLRLTLLESEPLPQLLVQKEYDPDAIESPVQTPYDDEQGEAKPEDVSVWLNILNSPENDREPAEYNKEITLVQSRRITEPAYRIAAIRWPKYAEVYWQKLRPQVCSLFRIQKSYNFVQWVLEYARETYPRTFGTMALSPRCLLELTDALCNGSILPLHIAAAFGLPNLCRDLLSMGANVNQPGLLGTPLYCALVGSKVLITRTEPVSWPTLLVGNDSDVDQAATVLLLVENGADCSFRYSWKDASEEVSLAGLAFWTAMKTKHEAIFTNIIKGFANATKGSTDTTKGDALDSSFCLLLQREPVVKRGLLHRTRFARLLTYVYDLTLADIEKESTEHNWLQELVARLMVHANIKLCPLGDGKVDTLKDNNFAAAVRTAVLDFNVILVDRLIKDPRFNANFKYDKEETLLHMAAESAQNEILEMLIETGADIRARDSSGRTPLMVCNEVSPMAKLILEHGVPTFDKDNGGRNIWHYFAATNEDDILKFLWDNDPYKIRNLNAVDEQGHTPLQSAFAHVEALQQSPKTSTSAAPFAAYFLLEKSQGYIRAEGNENLARWAVEWGNLGLVRQLFHLFPQVNMNDELLLKSLNMSASPEMVSLVLERAGPSRPFADGTTAAETVITNVKLLKEGRLTRNPSSHPSCAPQMTRSAYMQLLTPEVIKSRDSKGRGIWLRFTQDVIPLISTRALEHPPSLYFLSSFMMMAISCLVKAGALADYEKESKKWAISCIATRGEFSAWEPRWESWHMPFVATILSLWLYDPNRHDGELGIMGFFNEDEAAILLWTLVKLRMPEVVELLVQCGCDAHKPRPPLPFDGRSVFERFLADQPIDVSMIRPLLHGTKPHHIRKQQQYTFTELVRVADEAIAVEILGRLIDRGLDVDGLEIPATSPMKSPASSPSLLTIAICSKKILLGRLLIERGADASLAPPNSISAYLLAAKLGYVVILEMIIEKVGSAEFPWLVIYEHMEDRDTYNALQFAAAGGHRDALTTLLEATPLADKITAASPRFGRTCAHLAAKAGSLDCVKILMRYSKRLFSVRDLSGRTPLFLAIVGGNQELIQYMKDNLLDYDNPQDMGIISLNPVPAQKDDDDDSDSDSLPESSHGEATHEQKISEPRQIGAMIADAIDHYQLSRDPLFRSILDHTSRKDLVSAIMPCGGCTLLSYTATTNKIRPMLELVELGFRDFVAGCEEHWPDGYNALLCACQNIRMLMTTDLFIPADKARSFFKLCLDAYLKAGMSWFHLPISPIHALFHPRNSGQDMVYHQRIVLEVFITHLTEHAQRYWAQMRAIGVTAGFEFSANESIQRRVLRYALNLRKQVTPDNTDATHTKLLIKNGADVNAQDSELVTPLHLAALYGQMDMVLTLLRAGANPNLLCAHGSSPLGCSVAYGDFRVTRCLLSNGASPMTSFDITFDTVDVDVDIMRQLIELGADPYEARPGTGSTLTNAIYGSAKGMSLVLNGNFDFHRLADQEPLLLSEILAHRKLSSIELKAIIKRMPHEYRARLVNFEPDDKHTPSFYIIRDDDPKLLQVLLDMGLDIEREWHGKGTPLMFAASIGALKCFKLLVRHGARLAYLTTGRRGEVIARSVTEIAKLHPRLLQWALIDRHYETKYLTQAAHNETFIPTKSWSGGQRAVYRVSGTGDEIPQLPTESMLDLLHRTARMKRGMRGRVLFPVDLCEITLGFEPW
ncbi:uncharacterized protein FSUBG_3042 [Fusarium subglutinans]|uniref:Ankyrin n=1 Tax=Gibberella subglutinans TaxID=42677 RepID=A0A8H5V4L1_GIBSU|nr:uncharacterized protein FSUBG_3042 [Fusarium subglutinans]KAF5610426.1 hypothetical protein FSUBG_3042 [Fusarium subglutinans]